MIIRRFFWISVTVLAVILIASIVFLNVYSFKRILPADCADEEIISKIYDTQEVKNFVKGHPQYGFESQGHREHFPSQCQYWFYDTDDVKQSNLWIVIDKARNFTHFTKGMCFDNDSEEPRKIDPFKVPDLTSENCNHAY